MHEHLLAEIRHFFEVYKALEPAKQTDVGRWDGRDAAWAEIASARETARRAWRGSLIRYAG